MQTINTAPTTAAKASGDTDKDAGDFTPQRGQ
jgi:hypothetical protein